MKGRMVAFYALLMAVGSFVGAVVSGVNGDASAARDLVILGFVLILVHGSAE